MVIIDAECDGELICSVGVVNDQLFRIAWIDAELNIDACGARTDARVGQVDVVR